jgi:hypothetical protein
LDSMRSLDANRSPVRLKYFDTKKNPRQLPAGGSF